MFEREFWQKSLTAPKIGDVRQGFCVPKQLIQDMNGKNFGPFFCVEQDTPFYLDLSKGDFYQLGMTHAKIQTREDLYKTAYAVRRLHQAWYERTTKDKYIVSNERDGTTWDINNKNALYRTWWNVPFPGYRCLDNWGNLAEAGNENWKSYRINNGVEEGEIQELFVTLIYEDALKSTTPSGNNQTVKYALFYLSCASVSASVQPETYHLAHFTSFMWKNFKAFPNENQHPIGAEAWDSAKCRFNLGNAHDYMANHTAKDKMIGCIWWNDRAGCGAAQEEFFFVFNYGPFAVKNSLAMRAQFDPTSDMLYTQPALENPIVHASECCTLVIDFRLRGTNENVNGSSLSLCFVPVKSTQCALDNITKDTPTSCAPSWLNTSPCKSLINDYLENVQYLTNEFDNYCKNYPTDAACRCINRFSDPAYDLLAPQLPSGAGCWYLPCKQEPVIVFKTAEVLGHKNCSVNICQNNLNFTGSSESTMKNVKQVTNCNFSNLPPTTPSPTPSPGLGDLFNDLFGKDEDDPAAGTFFDGAVKEVENNKSLIVSLLFLIAGVLVFLSILTTKD